MDAEERDKCGQCGHPQDIHEMSYCKHYGERHIRCSCDGFVSPIYKELSVLSYDDKQKLACATHLKISPDRIYYIGSETDGSGHFTGLHVNSTFISIERYIGWWVRLALPREMTDEIQAFIDKRRKRTA